MVLVTGRSVAQHADAAQRDLDEMPTLARDQVAAMACKDLHDQFKVA